MCTMGEADTTCIFWDTGKTFRFATGGTLIQPTFCSYGLSECIHANLDPRGLSRGEASWSFGLDKNMSLHLPPHANQRENLGSQALQVGRVSQLQVKLSTPIDL